MRPLEEFDRDVMEENLESALRQFGFKELRGKQKEVIHRLVLDNASAVCVMPTGGGKSLCYQLPSLCFSDGLTLVVSPLIALMKDQCDALIAKGINAARLDSSNTFEEARAAKDGIRDGSLKLLHLLKNEAFIKSMRNVKIALLAVDEAHCVSSWGHSFRPDYLKVSRFAKDFNVERVLCLTATATVKVAQDICAEFDVDPEQGCFMAGVCRSNLRLLTETMNNEAEKNAHLIRYLKTRSGPAIIYVTVQKQAEDVCKMLKNAGFPDAAYYHAGMTAEDRKNVQEAFIASDRGIIACTIAFGMGIDKSNIRSIVHYSLSKTLEKCALMLRLDNEAEHRILSYSQECGRAGRDGLPSDCIAYLCGQDMPILRSFVHGDTPNERSIYSWLKSLASLPVEQVDAMQYFIANRYQQSRDNDIKEGTLALLYARLELEYNMLRASTPMYAVYDCSPKSPTALETLSKDNDAAAIAIRLNWKSGTAKGKSKYAINCEQTALVTKVPRDVLASKISQWEREGLIDSKGSQVRHRYALLKPLPKEEADIARISKELYAYCEAKEQDQVERMESMCELLSSENCLHQGLCNYFGDANGPGKCGDRCSACINGKGTPFGGATQSKPVDLVKAASVLNLIADRGNPRLLTNFAFGISSPKLSYELRLTKHKDFGCMADNDFSQTMKYFEQACASGSTSQIKETSESASKASATKTGIKRSSSAKENVEPAKKKAKTSK